MENQRNEPAVAEIPRETDEVADGRLEQRGLHIGLRPIDQLNKYQ
jgi:hypothetical protein